jgi:Fe2+ transport system protein FeoA
MKLRHNLNSASDMKTTGTTGTLEPLGNARNGQKVRVARLDAQPTLCHRLREMGFCEDAEVTVVQNSAAMVCLVCGSRICLSHQLAGNILVKKSEP